MPDAFDMLGDPVTTDKGTIYDYDASLGEAFGAGFDRQMDTNPLALVARQARFFSEDMGSLAGIGERVDQKTAEEEVRRRGLDLKIPKGGITRYELDTLQYLKQREIAQNTVGARARGITGAAAGFAGGVAGSFTDPINIASNFIPFVSEARYASWLARAGTSTLARAGVRAGAGAIEGAAGAAVLEPLVYAGATSQQLDYTSTDSFMNVVFGGVMGGGLHPVGGAVYDARVSRALRGLDPGIWAMRDAVASAPDHVKRDILQAAVAQVERGEPVDVGPQINAWHASPHVFDSFDISKVGSGEGQQAFGHGIYLAESEAIAGKGGYYEAQFQETHGTSNTYQVQVTARSEDFLDWNKPIGEQSPQVQEAIKRIPQVAKLSADDAGMNVYSVLLNSKKADGSTFTKADISEALKAEGIKGIRHAAEEDGGKSRNLVVFDDKDVRIVSRNGEPIGQRTPRDLGGLIEQAKADRSEAAFNRQFGDEASRARRPFKYDAALDAMHARIDEERRDLERLLGGGDEADEATSRAADEAATKASEDLQTVAEDVKFLDEQIKGLKSRELWTKADDDAIAQGDEAAKAFEKEASIYRAAAVCMMEG